MASGGEGRGRRDAGVVIRHLIAFGMLALAMLVAVEGIRIARGDRAILQIVREP